jgi:hypothetical protein
MNLRSVGLDSTTATKYELMNAFYVPPKLTCSLALPQRRDENLGGNPSTHFHNELVRWYRQT